MAKSDRRFAFPSAASNGMTMRQYYKATTLSGILQNAEVLDVITESDKKPFHEMAWNIGRIADAMIAEDEEFLRKPK